MRAIGLLLALGVAGCAGPPPSAYVGGNAQASGGAVGLGNNAAGEACVQHAAGSGADIFCGAWDQPSGRVIAGGAADASGLRQLATSSAWRSGIDNRFDCADPAPTTALGSEPGLLLSCTRRVGGWPQVALVAAVNGRVYYADGILPALPVLERSIGVLSGRITADAAPSLPPGRADALLASRLAAQSFKAGDLGHYQDLMLAGTRANLAESYVAAERAYRAALTLQQKALGTNDPNTAVPLTYLALQVSDQGRTGEADEDFARAARLAPQAADGAALPRLHHYQALNYVNEGKPAEALPLLQQAEAEYAALLPPSMLALRPARVAGPIAQSRRSGGGGPQTTSESLLMEPDQQAALVGVIETRRYQAIALRDLDRPLEAREAVRSAAQLAASRGLTQHNLTARLYRTASLVDDTGKLGDATADMLRASHDFADAQPGTRPLAQTELLRAAQLWRNGSPGSAIEACRTATTLLRELKTGTSVELVAPCLAAYAAAADKDPAHAQTLLGNMFQAAQLAQGGITVQQIALASARLSEGSRDNAVGVAIRRQQDAGLTLADLQRRYDAVTQSGARPGAGGETLTADALGKRIAEAQATLADADAALQAAAPNYGQLVQEVASAPDVLAALAPGEGFVSMSLARDSGWLFLLRDGQVRAAPTHGGSVAVAALVKRLRASIETGESGPPAFDAAAAQALYADTLGQFGAGLDGLASLTVAPVGPLLSVPFGALLTGPVTGQDLATAPWLIRRFAITHVPAPTNFVSLRRVSLTSRAQQPWFGFGDFRPVSLAQAERSFPSGACQDSAKLFAGLPPLPYARRELDAARALLGGNSADSLEGAAFTTPRVLQTDLRPFRVLHFATHALLPTDLHCQNEPAIVTSDPAGAKDAAGALLTSSDVTALHLDADVVILSACNSGGPDGATSGESLSGLARAFFYAGARALMVTHWSVNDQATAFLVAGTLQRLRAGDPAGVAGALQKAQVAMLDGAGHTLPASIAHPFYWAPFALVGEGRGRTVSAAAEMSRRL